MRAKILAYDVNVQEVYCPGCQSGLMVLDVNLLGDGLRDIPEPRSASADIS